jgi:uncharacterized protein YjiS (DUF1127 family)
LEFYFDQNFQPKLFDIGIDRYVIPRADEKIDIASEVSNLHRLEAERSELERKIDDYLRDLGIKI